MYTNGFGEVIVDVLTINPAIRSISSASAILDVSNYTINAVTLGKDANGFKYHGHTVESFDGTYYNNQFLTFRRYNTLNPSSYHTSATHAQFSSVYSSVPNYPKPTDTRLERGSTLTNVSGTSDVGHYLNAAIDQNFSNAWNVIGAYPPSGNVGKYKMLDFSGGFVASGNLSGVWNTFGVVDKNGFIKLSELNGSAAANALSVSAPYIYTLSSVSASPTLNLFIVPRYGDGASLAAFGGVNHIGLWCLDIKEMLASGLVPPYSWNNINNTRKYKLVAKVTTWDDLMVNNDNIVIPSVLEYAGFKDFLVSGGDAPAALLGKSPNHGPGIVVKLNFK